MECESEIRLTRFSRGGGCGCKISPKVLNNILDIQLFPTREGVKKPIELSSRDDAAIYELDNGKGLVYTTDFFMPVVDDPYDFGRIAAANAISDVYAMGGTPMTAMAILGWPITQLSSEHAQQVLKGAVTTCEEAGIMIGGGHSIDNQEPVFGLAVNGLIEFQNIKRNNTAGKGDLLYLTKPLGVGILSTAIKKGIIEANDSQQAIQTMMQLNKVGEELAKLKYVTAMTDVTGFGLFGHLLEMCEKNCLVAHINFDSAPCLPNLEQYINADCVTGGGGRNWDSYKGRIHVSNKFHRIVLSDPQTNGGLLVAVERDKADIFEALFKQGQSYSAAYRIGEFGARMTDGKSVFVE